MLPILNKVMRRHRLIVLVLLFVSSMAFASMDSTAIFQGYSGGMMLHAGYLFGDNPAAVFWSILELFEQAKRVERGWFPPTPHRKYQK